MTTPILQLKSLGIDDLMKFDWVSAPPAESVLRALEGLVASNMIGEDGRLTVIGEQVAECPVEVGVARMVRRIYMFIDDHGKELIVIYQLFASKDYNCGEEILTIAAMTSVQVCHRARWLIIMTCNDLRRIYLSSEMVHRELWTSLKGESSPQRKA
jgi:ATP-dependent RNA helicase DDX35